MVKPRKLEHEAETKITMGNIVRTTLLAHQEQALEWLHLQEESKRGGLLNDAEGLGKSLSMLSLMAFDKAENRRARTTTLVLVSMHEQTHHWMDQLRKHVFDNMFQAKYLTQDCMMRRLRGEHIDVEADKHDVVLFSYDWYTNLHADLVSVRWRRVIFDDAEYLLKLPDEMIQHLSLLDAEFKWAVTGKPVLNGSHDVAPLLAVLGFQNLMYLNLNDLRMKISLRRTREVLGLPPRNIDIQFIDFSPRERELYEEVMVEARDLLVRLESLEDSKVNDSDIYTEYEEVGDLLHHKIRRLIRICIDSAMYYYDSGTDSNPSDIEDAALRPDLLQKVPPLKDIICPICARPSLPRAIIVTSCGHIFCRPCIRKHIIRNKNCPCCQLILSNSDLFSVPIPDASIEPFMRRGSSSKISALVKHVMKSREECSNQKSLIFSEEAKLLLLLESHFERAGFKTWLDDFGATLTKCNAELQAEDGATIVFASSQAVAGFTPHLKHVSTVYLMEPIVVPEIEDRIIKMVHCIGQTKPVNIVKFIVKNSIEEKILELEQIKRERYPEAFNVHRHNCVLDWDDMRFVMEM